MLAKDGSYDNPEEWVEYISSNINLTPGMYTVVVNATDSAGNIGTDNTTILVVGWLTGWQYRKSHTIIGSTAGAVTDYQVKITVHYGPGTDSGADVYLDGKCQPDFDDIRFTASDGKTLLSYWIEEKVDGSYAVVWVKIPSIPASPGNTTIYIYYGNPTAISESDGDSTFIFFDDFETGSLTKWSTSNVNRAGVGTHTARSGIYSMYTRGGVVNVTSSIINLSNVKSVLHIWVRRGSDDFSEDPDAGEDLLIRYLDKLGQWVSLEQFQGAGQPGEIFERTYILPDDALHSGFRVMVRQVDGDSWRGLYYDYWHIDDVFIRRYISPEPVHDGWGSEEVFSP